jgi:hypothetical protein
VQLLIEAETHHTLTAHLKGYIDIYSLVLCCTPPPSLDCAVLDTL